MNRALGKVIYDLKIKRGAAQKKSFIRQFMFPILLTLASFILKNAEKSG